MGAKKHVAIVCPYCRDVELIVDGRVYDWVHKVKTTEICEAVKMDENLDYELEDLGIDTEESYWVHDGCGYQYAGDIADLGVVFHVDEEDNIVLDKVGTYWKENINELKNILSREFGKMVK